MRATLVASLLRLWEETLCWFGPDDDPTMHSLSRDGIIDATPDDLRRRYLQHIMPTLSSLDIAVPVTFNIDSKSWELRQSLPWNAWDPRARRMMAT